MPITDIAKGNNTLPLKMRTQVLVCFTLQITVLQDLTELGIEKANKFKYLMSSNIYVFFLHIPGHTKVSYLTHLSFTDQYISSC